MSVGVADDKFVERDVSFVLADPKIISSVGIFRQEVNNCNGVFPTEIDAQPMTLEILEVLFDNLGP